MEKRNWNLFSLWCKRKYENLKKKGKIIYRKLEILIRRCFGGKRKNDERKAINKR